MILVFAGHQSPKINKSSETNNKFKHFGSLRVREQKIINRLNLDNSRKYQKDSLSSRS